MFRSLANALLQDFTVFIHSNTLWTSAPRTLCYKCNIKIQMAFLREENAAKVANPLFLIFFLSLDEETEENHNFPVDVKIC